MPSSYTSRYGLELPVTNDLVGTWGTQVNNAITSLVDESLDAISSIAMADANQTLTITNGASSPNRAGTLVLTGALTATRTLTLPAGNRVVRVVNLTTGGFAVDVKSPTSTSMSVSNGYMAILYTQGTSIAMPSYQTPAIAATTAIIGSAAIGFSDGAVGTPSITFTLDGNTGFYRIGADQIGVATGGVLRATFANSSLSLTTDLSLSATAPTVTINSSAVNSRSIDWSTAGSLRWKMLVTNTAESGANAGSAWRLTRYDDAGASLGNVFLVDRDTGNIAINNTATVSNVKMNVVNLAADALTNPITVRLTNLENSSESSTAIGFAVGGTAALRGQVRGQREASTNNGKLILSSALAGAAVDVLTLNSDGSADFVGDCAAVTFTVTSDERLKTDVQPISGALDRISMISGVTFNMRGAEDRRAGVIAQNVRQHFDVAVSETDGQYYGVYNVQRVDPMALIALLIESVKELRAEIDDLRSGSIEPNRRH